MLLETLDGLAIPESKSLNPTPSTRNPKPLTPNQMLLATLDGLGDGQARTNMLKALSDVRPTHLLGPSSSVSLCGPPSVDPSLKPATLSPEPETLNPEP